MPEILTFSPNQEIPKENFWDKIKKHWNTFSSQNLFTKISLVTMILILLATPIIIEQQTNLFSHAAPINATITIDPAKVVGKVNPLVFGQDVYYPNGTEPYYLNAQNKVFDDSFLQLTNKLSPTLIRCGGGLDSEWYHWTDGIGPISLRPVEMMKRSKTPMINTFGTDECLQLAEKLRATAAITVDDNDYPISTLNPWNPQATPKEAAAWVAYVNGSPTNSIVIGVDEHGKDWKTVGYWAQKRVQNGHSNPYNIVYWEIGNEDYSFSGQLGTSYATRFILFRNAMKQVDPSIKLGAVMHNDLPLDNWNRQVIRTTKNTIDYLIYHDYLIESVAMERLFGQTTLTKSIQFPVPVNNGYTVTLHALTAYNANGNSQVKVQIDGLTVFDGVIDRNHDNFNTIAFHVSSSQINAGIHVIAFTFYNIQHSVDLQRSFSVNNTNYDFYSEQQLYEKRLATTQNILQHITQLRGLASQSGLESNFPIYISEYDTLDSYATPTASYTSSIITASMLATYIQNGVDLASFWLLNDESWWSATAPHASTGIPHFANAQFYTMELLRHHTSHDLIQTQISAPASTNGLPLLQAYTSLDSTTKPNPIMHVVVINKSYNQNITTQINFKNSVPFANATVTTLNAPAVSSTITSASDNTISLKSSQIPGYLLTYTFPAHSVTAIDVDLQLPPTPTPTPTMIPKPTLTATATPLPTSTPTSEPTSAPTFQTIFGPISSTIKGETNIVAGDSSTEDIKISFSFTPYWSQTSHDQHTGIQLHIQNQQWGGIFFRSSGVFYTTHSDTGYGHERMLASLTIPDNTTHSATIMLHNNSAQVTVDGKQFNPFSLSMPTSGSLKFYSYWLSQVDFINIVVQKILYR